LKSSLHQNLLNDNPTSCELLLEPVDNKRLAELCGPFNEHLSQVENFFGVQIHHRGNTFKVVGSEDATAFAGRVITQLYEDTNEQHLTPAKVSLALNQARAEATPEAAGDDVIIRVKAAMVKARTPNQRHYLRNVQNHTVNFAVGPAGTGKTFLAVASAVQALEQERVRRLVLVRPAVEAGERLGFLPGDLVQKVDPYLRPLYDALYEMLGFDRVARFIERQVIEIAPLAFMRGRSLNESFIILDEAQNTTVEQMKMFLTRIGFGSKAVVAGDPTQIDLPRNTYSGLKHVVDILSNVEGISFTHFASTDVVRHPLVQRIVEAYQTDQQEQGETD